MLTTGVSPTPAGWTGDADPSEARLLVELGYRSLLMLSLPVDGEPFALIEVYDRTTRAFGDGEVRLCQALAVEAGRDGRPRAHERAAGGCVLRDAGRAGRRARGQGRLHQRPRRQIADLAGAVCDQLGIPPADARIVRLGALLHDIGKIGIPEAILRKAGPLDEEEMRRSCRSTPTIGARILEPVPYFADLVPLVSVEPRALRRHAATPTG